MTKGLYPRLAAQNIRREAKFYLPYLFTLIGVCAAFYIVTALSQGDAAPARLRYVYLSLFLGIGKFVVAAFAVVFLTYTASFLSKRRQRELGLYAILGMEKRHIGAVLGWETLYLFLLGLTGGVALGWLLQAAVSWALCAAMRIPPYFSTALSWSGISACAILLGGVLLFNLLLSLRRVHARKPAELLRENAVGEKEPKTRWLLALLGVLALGGGYAIALCTRSAMDAIAFYFLAVFLVIIGTYCLFTALSILILKLLRRNKGYYYQTAHFIGLSGMLHRMKRNAVGLANICILCTMVLVMVSGTLSLYLSSEKNLQAGFPGQCSVEADYSLSPQSGADTAALERTFQSLATQAGYQPQAVRSGSYFRLSAVPMEDGSFLDSRSSGEGSYVSASLTVLSAGDYSALTGQSPVDDGLAHLYTTQDYSGDTLTFRTGAEGKAALTFPLGAPLSAPPEVFTALRYVSEGDFFLVLPPEDYAALLSARQGDTVATYLSFWDLGGDEAGHGDFLAALPDRLEFQSPDLLDAFHALSFQSRAEFSADYYGLNGGFFFLGLFLGLLFLLATVLMIYYKQLSEGYEDKARYHIMVQVGLTPRDVKRSINSQMRVVFFAPLAVAAIHVAFDFPLVTQLLQLFGAVDVPLTIFCTLAVLAAFCLLYVLVYRLTARFYCKIVG